MKKRALAIVMITSILLSGCGSDAFQQEMLQVQSGNNSIHLSIDGATYTKERNLVDWYKWGELDQLTTYKNIRRTWDNKLQIIKFDKGSKNGVIFIGENGEWQGNNTLYNAFQNKKFVTEYWNDGKVINELSKPAVEQFSDIDNDSTGIYASVNAYYNILPTNVDGTSGLTDTLSRAEAMSAIYRGDTPSQFLTENEEFNKAVGTNAFNKFAVNAADNSYLDYRNGGLCYDTYNRAITFAEVIYILVNRYYKNEYDNIQAYDCGFTDCKNAGDVAATLGLKDNFAWQAYELEYCLQTGVGCPESLYKAMLVAYRHGIVGSTTAWDSTVVGGKLLNYMIRFYKSIYDSTEIVINAKLGKNEGKTVIEIIPQPEPIEEPVEPDTEIEIETEEPETEEPVEEIDITDLDTLTDLYSDEIDMSDDELDMIYDSLDGWTFDPVDKWLEVAYCYWLNVRTGPSTDYEILSSVQCGTKAHVVAVCRENGWFRIIANKKIVYQCGVYFKEIEDENWQPEEEE